MKRLASILCLAGAVLCPAAEQFFPVVKDGKAVAELVVPEDRGCMEASMILEKYIGKSTGCRMDAPAGSPQIVFQIEKGKLDPDGFRFSFPAPNKMVITGGSSYGIKNAALDFCERFMGIRFLYPGPAGEHIPKLKDILVPMKEFSDAPKYFTRNLDSGRKGWWGHTRYYDWAALHRGCELYRLDIGHNLYKMFAAKKYEKTHPDFYPIINGKRYIPPDNMSGVHWQVCMTNPAVIDEAVRMICDAFAKDPNLRTWSLGQTDGDGWCECENCKKFYPNPDVPTKFGNKDRSLLYVQFCNKIAERVAAKYPEARFSIFAYGPTSFAPKGVKLHPSLVPVITYDRLNWIDPERKAMDMERQKSWSDIAAEVCWWDYYCSNLYVLPRITVHHIANQLREGYNLRVRHAFIQHTPLMPNRTTWAEGPVAYMTLKLLWDPFQDESKLLDEWCTTAVGPEAAPYLRNYYERVEEFWTKRVQQSAWFKRCARTYLVYTWHDYLNVLDRDFFDKCDKDFEMVCKLAPEGDCKVRAEYFRSAYQEHRDKAKFWLRNNNTKLIAPEAFTKVFFEEHFNEGVGGWTLWEHRHFPGQLIYFAPTDGINNTGALDMRFRNGGMGGGASKTFKITEPKNFRMEIKYKCIGTDENVIPYISAEWCDDKDQPLDPDFLYYTDIHAKPSNEWATTAINFTTPDKLPAWLRVRICISGSKTGKVLYDDLVIKEIPKK